jgi:outer membrane protein assembly complex protein YaeT
MQAQIAPSERNAPAGTKQVVTYNIANHSFIEPYNPLYLRRGAGVRLGGALVTGLATLAMAAAAPAWERQGSSPNPHQEEIPAPPQVLPALNSMSRYIGLTIHSIGFPGMEEAEQARLRQLIAQKTGMPLDRESIRSSIQTLYATGRFADVQVEAELTPENQVALTIVSSPNFFVGQVLAETTVPRPTPNQVANATKLQLGDLYSREKLNRAMKSIQRLMEENGFYHSSTSIDEQKHPQTGQVDLLFHITPGPHARIGRVAVTGSPGLSEGQVQDIAKMHPAEPVSAERVTRALDRLRKKYQKRNRLLAQVSVEHAYREQANVVDYTFHIEPGPVVEISAEGFKISRGVLKKNVPVYEENALDDDLLNEGRRNLLNYLQSRGYFDATVGIKKQSDSSTDTLRAIYVISAGARHKLVKVSISGNNSFPEDLLRQNMQVQPAGRLLSRGRYSQALLTADVRSLENLYRSNGFQQVKVVSTVLDDYQGQENQLGLEIRIEEGPQTLVSDFHIVGNRSISEDQLSYLNIQPGQAYSEGKIADDREIVLNYYFNHGFPNATFEASAQPAAEPNRMNVTYTIYEGQQIFVDQVLVSGLQHTRPNVVQRELEVKPETPVSEQEMVQTQTNLYDLGIFSQVDTAVQNPEGAEAQKNVLVAVQEAKRYTFNYGLGLEFQTGQPAVGTNQPQGETGVSPRVSFEVNRLNFRGRNQTLTFKTHVGRLQQRALVSYLVPSLFNSADWRFSFTSFYDNTLDVTTFSSQRLEATVQAEQTVTRAYNRQPVSTMFYRFTYRRVKAADFAPNFTQDEVPLLSQPVRVGMPGFTYIRDKRNNPLETSKGNYTTIDAGVADSHFGSEADFSRVLLQNSTYQPFGKNPRADRKMVFARSTRIGIQNAFGNTVILRPGQVCPPGQTSCPGIAVVPIPERFFSGGGNSHRGFGLNQAGPRDPGSGFPVGGSALFISNLELRFPPVTLPFVGNDVSFAIFHDMGNVFTNGNDMLHSLGHWRQRDADRCRHESTKDECNYDYLSHAIGVGVRYKTPIGPIRFDFGYNLNPPVFPSCQAKPTSSSQGTSTVCPGTSPYFVPQQARHFNVFFSIGQTF